MSLVENLDSQQSTGTDAINAKIDEIFQLIKDGEQRLQNQYGQQNAILVFGNNKSGKRIFTKWISDNDAGLASKEGPVTFGGYVIEEYVLSESSHFTSDVILPELMINNNTGTAYYNFPDFISTRGTVYDIATFYFSKKVIQNVKNVKLVFFCNYASIMNDGSWTELNNLVTNATKVVKNFDKFKDSVMFLVSNADKNKDKFSHEEIVTSLASSLEKMKTTLRKEMNEGNVDNSKSMQFLDVILRKDGDVYPHIQLFRSPGKEGLLSEIPLMRENKRNVTAALENLNYTLKKDTDFDYVIPKQSFADVGILLEAVHRNILDAFKSFGQQAKELMNSHADTQVDIDFLHEAYKSIYDTFFKSQEMGNRQKEPGKCVRVIALDITPLVHDILVESLTNAMKYGNHSSFLYAVSDYPLNSSFKCGDGLNDFVEYLEKSYNWFKFLHDLYYNKLSTYDVQKNTTESACNDLTKFVIQRGRQNENKSSDILEPLVKKCDPQHEYNLNATIMDKPKLNKLSYLLNLTMNYRVNSLCHSNELLIKGQYVKLSDIHVYEKKCQSAPKFIHIFAIHKLFLDQDFEKTGEIQLIAIAESWDAHGDPKIVLRGEEAKPLNVSKAADGNLPGEPGKKGMPGLPGGPGGRFFGIGWNFETPLNFTVSSIGGRGGPGQHGGDGAPGKDGKDAYNDLDLNEPYPKKSPGHTVLKQTAIKGTFDPAKNSYDKVLEEIYVLQGEDGQAGGSGGDGGIGGSGGVPGVIFFLPVYEEMFGKMKWANGSRGLGGKGGVGGKGGRYGRNGQVHIWNSEEINETIKLPRMEFTLLNDSIAEGSKGSNGLVNTNDNGIQNPRQSEPTENELTIVEKYVDYLKDNMNHSVVSRRLVGFHNSLESILKDLNTETTETTTTTPTTKHDISIASVSINAGNNLKSPINTAINLITDFFVPLKFTYPTLLKNYKIIKDGIESMFIESTPSQPYAYSTATSINGAIALADFLVRCFTKVKPQHSNNEKTTDILEVRAATLNIIFEFETVLNDLLDELNLFNQSLKFDPVSLIRKLDEKLTNRDYQNLTKLLFQFIDDNAHLKYENFENDMQPKINQILTRKNEGNLH